MKASSVNRQHVIVNIVLLFLPIAMATNLWALSSFGMLGKGNEKKNCNHANFVPFSHTWDICMKNNRLFPGLRLGMQLALHECRRVLENSRWNCSGDLASIFETSNKEGAFLQALGSAGVSYGVSLYCERKRINQCHCWDSSEWKHVINGNMSFAQQQRKQYGCTAGFRIGSRFARNLVEAGEHIGSDPQSDMRRHNGRVGRRLVRKVRKLHCHCYGDANRCTEQVCWKTMGNFSKVADEIRRQYDKAVKVRSHPKDKKLIVDIKYSHSGEMKPKKLRKSHLTFLENSNNYCNPVPALHIPGTSGRQCNVDGPGSCDIICCGRGYDTVRTIHKKDCNARFVWCCNVTTDTCSETEDRFYCKAPPSSVAKRLTRTRRRNKQKQLGKWFRRYNK